MRDSYARYIHRWRRYLTVQAGKMAHIVKRITGQDCLLRRRRFAINRELYPLRLSRRYVMGGRGGIGRRAALRSLWGKTRGSSSLLGRTIFSSQLYTFVSGGDLPPVVGVPSGLV